MDTKRLGYFLAIFEARSITKAAAIVGLAQPALSQQLAILERELGVELFKRTAAGVFPTASGEALYGRAGSILRQFDLLKEQIVSRKGEISGSAVAGFPPTIGLWFGERLLAATLAAYPTIRLRLVEASNNAIAEQLTNGAIDIALLTSLQHGASFKSEMLFHEPLYIVACSRTEPPGTAIADLARLPWVVPGIANVTRQLLSSLFAGEGLAPNIVSEIDSLPLVIHAVTSGVGVTLLPKSAVEKELAAEQVQLFPLAGRAPQRTVHLAWRQQETERPAVQALLEMTRDMAAQMPGRTQTAGL